MIRRRMGRPGLLGTMARTTVIAGTATAVSGRMQRNAAERSAEQQQSAEFSQQQLVDQAAAQAAAQVAAQQAPAAPAAAAPAVDRVSQLATLADLRNQGVLTEAEFTAEKARILAG
ncbi:SHOCT domain-containing protein [Streptacidiphilus albus]|uniref:SHOCT domain-containing protein n=1 Tax=Streptacidiphilus albus TaxID=105425 RepID=UPI000ABDDFB8|nr:SHOCT domain-containing protein [Streptacidiphilus albus]